MIRYLTLIIFNIILSSNFIFGQTPYQEVVYLKNGKILRGVIIEQIPNKSLKIQTADLSVFQFTLDEIDKITKEIIPSSKSNTSYLDNYPNNKPLEYKIPYDIIDRGVSKVLATKEFFWFGIDFALAKYTDPNKLDDANILINTFCPAWSKYFDEKFSHKKKERLFNVNLLLDRTDEIQLVNYLKINENDFMLTKPFSLSIKEIETQVKNYQLKEQSGIGIVILVENFNKVSRSFIANVIFFDINNKEILWLTKINGLPGGNGMTAYWGEALFEIFYFFINEDYLLRYKK